MPVRAPDEFRKVLEHPTTPVVVGGQAVNIWALRYREGRLQLNDFAPFVSKDCDIFAPLEDALKIAHDLEWDLTLSPRKMLRALHERLACACYSGVFHRE